MRALILVGGEGTRMRPLTYTVPKPLLPLMGRAFLDHVMDHLGRHGVHEVVLSSPYLEDAFAPTIERRHGDPAVVWITESEPLGTGGAVLNALDSLGDEPFFVLNGDILTDLDLTAMSESHVSVGASVTIATMHVDDARPFGLVIADTSHRISEFREKPVHLIPGEINAGSYLIDPRVLFGFDRRAMSIEREVFPRVIADGAPVFAFGSRCYWMDLGTPDQYLRAHFDILDGKVGGETYSAPSVDGSAKVDLRSRLGAWTVVGAGVSIASDAEVDESVLMDGSRVEEGARVRRAILGPDAVVGAGAFVVNAVLGEGAHLPAGTLLQGSPQSYAKLPSE